MQPDNNAVIYYNGHFLEYQDVHLNPLDRGFVFGDGIYEVIRVYAGIPFKLESHLNRLDHSLSTIRLDPPPATDWQKIIFELLHRNSLTETGAVVYIQVTRGSAPRTHAFPPMAKPTVLAMVVPTESPRVDQESGIMVMTHPDERWERCDIKSTNLLPNILAYQKAREYGASEALLHRGVTITEASHTTVFCVRDGHLLTHPLTTRILPGITREVIFHICAELNIEIVQEPATMSDLAYLDEMFICGTTTEIIPVTHYDQQPVGTGKPGPVTRIIQKKFIETTTAAPPPFTEFCKSDNPIT